MLGACLIVRQYLEALGKDAVTCRWQIPSRAHGTCFQRRLSPARQVAAPHSAVAQLVGVRPFYASIMKYPHFTLILTIIAAAAVTLPLRAGNLDNAPFQIIAPNGDWKLDEATSKQIAKDAFLVASLKNPKAQLISVVIRVGPFPPSASSLDNSCAGFRGSLKNPAVKMIADTEATYFGCKGRFFAYEATGQAGQTTYSETVMFNIGDTGWTVTSYGPSVQKEAVKQMITFFRNKP